MSKKKLAEWKYTKVTNLVRRDGKIYYAELKIAGKTYRKSLRTEKFDIAKMKLGLKLNEIRAAASKSIALRSAGCETLRECLDEWKAGEDARPDLKESTVEYNQRKYDSLERTMKDGLDLPAGKVTLDFYRKWWKKLADHYNPTYANNVLSVARSLVDMQMKAGFVDENPLLDFKWLKIPKVIKEHGTGEQMSAMIANIRAQRSRFSEESGDMVEMMAYTGMRPAEVQRLQAKDLLEDVILVKMGDVGTKNYQERSVPIMSELRDVVDRRRLLVGVGSLWSIKSPENAMRRACARLEFGFVITRYDCRHFFATRCIESGVDIPTVAKWLGYQDGGVTLMKRYSHVTDAHGLEVAKKVKLG